MQSTLRSFRLMMCIAHQEFGYMSMTRHVTNKIYIHFFLIGMTPSMWMEALQIGYGVKPSHVL